MNYQMPEKMLSGYNQTLGASSAQDCAKRVSEVQDQCQTLAMQVKRAEEGLDQLHSRLQSVVRSAAVSEPNKATPEPVLVPLASDLRECWKRLEILNARLGFILGNLEL